MARNPFRSEAEAYRFLLLTVAYFALIVIAATAFVVVYIAWPWEYDRERLLPNLFTPAQLA